MSSSKIDRSLEDIIKESKDSRKKGKKVRKPMRAARKGPVGQRPGRRIGERRQKNLGRERHEARPRVKRFSRPVKHVRVHPRKPKIFKTVKEEKPGEATRLWIQNLPETVVNSDLKVCFRETNGVKMHHRLCSRLSDH